jgi:hypothetical protein
VPDRSNRRVSYFVFCLAGLVACFASHALFHQGAGDQELVQHMLRNLFGVSAMWLVYRSVGRPRFTRHLERSEHA